MNGDRLLTVWLTGLFTFLIALYIGRSETVEAPAIPAQSMPQTRPDPPTVDTAPASAAAPGLLAKSRNSNSPTPVLIGAILDEAGDARYLFAVGNLQEALRVGEESSSGFRLERAEGESVTLRSLADGSLLEVRIAGGAGSGAFGTPKRGPMLEQPGHLSHRALRSNRGPPPPPHD